MNLIELLSTRPDKSSIDSLSDQIVPDKELFKKLITIFLTETGKPAEYSAWLLSHCHDKNKELIKPYIGKLIKNLNSKTTVAVKRNTLRVLQDSPIPSKNAGELADKCFTFLTGSETIAVKTFSLTVLENICRQEPELKKELMIIIEDQLPYASPAFSSRARKILKG